MRAEHYLVIPEDPVGNGSTLRWSESGDAVENGDGSTFAFGVEIIHFLEGFASQRPLIHFNFILHLLALLRPRRLPLPVPASKLSEAFYQPGRNVRNAGAFCALLCQQVPSVVHPPSVEQLWDLLMMPGWCAGVEEYETVLGGEAPPWTADDFETHVRSALQGYAFLQVVQWIREGCGSATQAAEKVAEEVLATRPRSLAGVLAALTGHVRLRESVPFVAQLVSALTLPPRQLIQPELPLGGFSDVSTRGPVEHLLPSQLVFDGLEFVRRHAHNELLYFRREEPQQPAAESLVVLLDQGVRTWGIVRIVLTAALFALGQLAGRKRLPLRLAATSNAGRPCDPLETPEADLEKLLAASDLSPHPGLALETVLEDEPDVVRDVVLLTHPRSLAEPDVQAAARRAGPTTRLFAVTVNDRGEVQLQQMRHGGPVSLSRFHVDLEPAIPAAPVENTAPRRAWQGDVEPIGYPFQLGIDIGTTHLFAFDHSGEHLLVAARELLFLVKTDGSGYEIVPKDSLVEQERMTPLQVLGVAGGFVVVWRRDGELIATHYDVRRRSARRHRFELAENNPLDWDHLLKCYYLRRQNMLVVKEWGDKEHHQTVYLATGRRSGPKEVVTRSPSLGLTTCLLLPLQSNGEVRDLEQDWTWPTVRLCPHTGLLTLERVVPAWEEFTPLQDNQPLLRGCKLLRADCQGLVLAVLIEEERRGKRKKSLRLFRGPQGIPQATVMLREDDDPPFVLSSDGRLLAYQVSPGELQVRETMAGGRVRLLEFGSPHEDKVDIELHYSWFCIRTPQQGYLLHWNKGVLVCHRSKSLQVMLAAAGLPASGERGRKAAFLGPSLTDRFQLMARAAPLVAFSDRFGQVALLNHSGELVCMILARQDTLAAWMPDGTCYGSPELLGCPETPGADVKIGKALLAVSSGTGSER